ncbi:MAG: 50S ribosomal protein L37e [Candidatus Nanoarchaeia archaeon]
MTKGTPAMGPKGKKSTLVIPCRRCGKKSYHVRNHVCSFCGYGATATLRRYSWQTRWKGKTKRAKK